MTIQTVINRYLTKIDELNIITEQLLSSDKKTAKKRFEDILIDAYIEGFASAAYMLGVDISLDYEIASDIVNQSYDGQSIADKFTNYLETADETSLNRLVESEFHRAYNAGALNGAQQSGKNVTKTWVTVLDDRVRETHSYLEGVTAPLDGYFHTFDGDKALAPGLFESASNNANCRCILKYSAQ